MAREIELHACDGSVWVLSGVGDGAGVQFGTDARGLYEGPEGD